MQEGSLFSTPSPAFIVCRLFNDGHSDWCEVVSHFSSDLHLSNNEWCWASFHVVVSHLYVFFGEMSLQVPFPLFDWVLSCMSCLYILKLILYHCSLCYHFLSFQGLFFHLVCSFLCCGKAFKFYYVPLVYFCFYFHYSRMWITEDLVLIYVIDCSAYKSLVVSGLTFRSLIHFE